ncbi:hypothetical protein BGZ79_002997 [Entomortierella chlamydospora]|nr:hypothetical protein BGZ79_002997 [Entomortierella chlamydospora]
MATALNLRFAIIGESETTKPYMRDVDGNMDTEELKKAIYESEKGLFEGVKSPSSLVLYRVSLRSSEYTSDREFSEDDAKPLMVIDGTISDYFQDGAEKNHIHIIVKRPEESRDNFIVPFEMLDSCNELESAIQRGECPLFVGHFQSGKTSTLQYLSKKHPNWFYFSTAGLSDTRSGLLESICNKLSISKCDTLDQLNYTLELHYQQPTVLIFDEFDYYLFRPNATGIDGGLQFLKEFAKAVNDKSYSMIRSILSSTVQGPMESDSQTSIYANVPSPWNSSSIIYASDFTFENHRHFFHGIASELGISIDELVIKDVFSRTEGYAGFEGLLAARCAEWTLTAKNRILRYGSYLPLITNFTRMGSLGKVEAVTHISSRLNSISNRDPVIAASKKLLGKFLQSGALDYRQIETEEKDALLHLQGLGIIKQGNQESNDYIFTTNVLFDLLSETYYPIGDRGGVKGFGNIDGSDDLIDKITRSFRYIRRTIFDELAVNAHSVAEAMVQGELYALLRVTIPYPNYRVYRETRTITSSEKKCDLWITNGFEYGIECKVNKASMAEIQLCASQAIDYGQDRENIKAIFLLNFSPLESQAINRRLPCPLPVGEYQLFTLQRRAVKHTLDQFKARKPELDAVEMEELRFERSPRGQFIYQHMLDDKSAPIEFSRRNFILKEGTEDEMIAYVTQVFNTHTTAV